MGRKLLPHQRNHRFDISPHSLRFGLLLVTNWVVQNKWGLNFCRLNIPKIGFFSISMSSVNIKEASVLPDLVFYVLLVSHSLVAVFVQKLREKFGVICKHVLIAIIFIFFRFVLGRVDDREGPIYVLGDVFKVLLLVSFLLLSHRHILDIIA